MILIFLPGSLKKVAGDQVVAVFLFRRCAVGSKRICLSLHSSTWVLTWLLEHFWVCVYWRCILSKATLDMAQKCDPGERGGPFSGIAFCICDHFVAAGASPGLSTPRSFTRSAKVGSGLAIFKELPLVNFLSRGRLLRSSVTMDEDFDEEHASCLWVSTLSMSSVFSEDFFCCYH